MQPVSAKHFVDLEFPAAHRALVPSALQTAYAAVDALYKQDPLFGVRSAVIGKGHVIAWAVDLQFERLIKSKQLPYDYRWVPFEKPTGEYLQIRLSASTLSISQLADPLAIPRHAHFRQNRILSNAPFLDLEELKDEQRVNGLPHLILGHGYQKLSFAEIGVLDPEPKNFGWIYRTPNLLNEVRAVELELPKEEATDAEAVITLKEEITKWVRDHDE